MTTIDFVTLDVYATACLKIEGRVELTRNGQVVRGISPSRSALAASRIHMENKARNEIPNSMDPTGQIGPAFVGDNNNCRGGAIIMVLLDTLGNKFCMAACPKPIEWLTIRHD